MTPRHRVRSGFWLAYTNEGRDALTLMTRDALTLMTRDFRRFVGKRSTTGLVVLHTKRAEFTELVSRWKGDFPGLKVLRYAKVQRINDSALVGASFFETA